MKVVGMHDESGCGWYRIRLPFAELGRHGHDVTTLLGSAGRPDDLANYPLIVGQRMDKHAALPYWRRLRLRSKLVYEIDDDVFHTEPANWMAHQVYAQPEVQDAVIHAAQVADLVTVTTEPLADVMRVHNPNVAILPNCIPEKLLEHERPRRDRVTVGWAGGASHAFDIARVAPTLRRFLARNPAVDLHLIGTDYGPTIKAPYRFTAWDPDPWGYYRNVDFDIGLAPLCDTVFDRSKSAIKALEYAALGIPVVASDVEPYRAFVLDGVTGFLVRHEHEWGKRLRELVSDEAMRAEMGAKARELAAGHTIERNWQLWESAYGGLLT